MLQDSVNKLCWKVTHPGELGRELYVCTNMQVSRMATAKSVAPRMYLLIEYIVKQCSAEPVRDPQRRQEFESYRWLLTLSYSI